jgi:STE24 endopeptidase
MQLLLIIAVLAAIVGGQSADIVPVSHASARAMLAIAGMLLVGIVASLITWHFVKLWYRAQLTRREWLRRLDRAQRFHTMLWLGIVLLTIFGLKWPQLVRVNWDLAHWPLVDDLVLLVPVVVPLLLSWAAFYQIELAIATDESPDAPPRDSLARHLWGQTRQQLATLLLPALLLLGVEDVLRRVAPQLLDDRLAWLWAGPALLLLLIGFPLILKRLWPTEELPAGPLRERLQNLLSEQGQQVRNFFVWHTGGRMVNAAVTGCLPSFRYIFLTDRMLDQFSEDQVAAVVAHELGHVRGKHLLLRVLAMLVPALFFVAIGQLLSGETLPLGLLHSATTFPLNGSFSASALLFPAGMILYAAIVLGKFSRLLELEADFLACCPVKSSFGLSVHGQQMLPEPTEQYLSTLARLAATGETPADHATWLHPSLTTRASFLLTLLQNPTAPTRFAQQMRRVRYLLFTSLGLGMLVNMWLMGIGR